MKTPIIRLSIGQNVNLYGSAINNDGDYVQIAQRFKSEHTARECIEDMRDSLGYEFQLVTMRDCADFKRTAAMV